MSGYVFVGNSTKPTEEQNNRIDDVVLDNVSKPCLQTAIEMGYEVFLGVNRNYPNKLACRELPISFYDSHTYRSIFNIKDNYIAYRNLCSLIDKQGIEAIHCNTPIGGMAGRFAGKKKHVKKIIYTAHGFHFYKGAPFLQNFVIKTAERIMARWTDCIITMNNEDYLAAQKFKMKKGGKVFLVHGVGINLDSFVNPLNREGKRREFGLSSDDFVLVSAGDLIKRKNYRVAIEAIALTNSPKIHYLICGKGPELSALKKYAEKCHVIDRVHFLGFRTDIRDILYASDAFLFSTLQEGLPRSMMEAMACGLPCIASRIRGNVDLLEDGVGGYLCDPRRAKGFADRITEMFNDKEKTKWMAEQNLKRIKSFDVNVVKKEIEDIYKEVLC